MNIKILRCCSLALIFCLIFLFNKSYAAEKYIVLSSPNVIEKKGTIKVVEYFWYGCPHCYQLEPYIEKWLQEKEDYIEFIRIPAVLNRKWLQHAKIFYVAKKLGILNKIHKELFKAIHVEKKKLMGRINLKLFFEENGVASDEFDKVYQSEYVKENIRNAYSIGQQYNLKGVPAIIINGKYGTTPSIAGGYNEVIQVINELAQSEHEKLIR
jgi:thiol:disulfide interchange protein DsbA